MNINVLVADESNKTRKNIVSALKDIGIESIQEATNGDQAVDTFRDAQFNVVLVDWNIQTKSGNAVIEEIRELDKDVTIIATTTESEITSASEANQPEISDFLVKPFTNENLREKLDKFATART